MNTIAKHAKAIYAICDQLVAKKTPLRRHLTKKDICNTSSILGVRKTIYFNVNMDTVLAKVYALFKILVWKISA